MERMADGEVLEHIRSAAEKVIGRPMPGIAGDAVIVELGIDSISLMDIVEKVETVYKVRINDEALEGLHTISDLVKLFQQAGSGQD